MRLLVPGKIAGRAVLLAAVVADVIVVPLGLLGDGGDPILGGARNATIRVLLCLRADDDVTGVLG